MRQLRILLINHKILENLLSSGWLHCVECCLQSILSRRSRKLTNYNFAATANGQLCGNAVIDRGGVNLYALACVLEANIFRAYAYVQCIGLYTVSKNKTLYSCR